MPDTPAKASKEQLETWLKHESFDPAKSHIVFISTESGISKDDAANVHLPGVRHVVFVFVEGKIGESVEVVHVDK